jgi:hypothetical protein
VGQIALGAGFPGDGVRFEFAGTAFSREPVVVVMAGQSGRPLAAAADAVTRKDFIVRLHDPWTGAPLDDGAGVDMRYVAIIPAAGSGIAAAAVDCVDGDTIAFARPFATLPVVVCSGYDAVEKATVLVSAAAVSVDSFRVSVRSLSGSPARARVSYIALVPAPDGSVYREVTIKGAAQTARQGTRVDFGTGYPTSPLGLLCSSISGGSAIAAAAGEQSNEGFTAHVAAPGGADPGETTFSWLGVSANH